MVVPLYTTHVEAIGRFLKIYGQTNQNEGIAIEEAIQTVLQKHPQAVDAFRCAGDNMIRVGSTCLSKYSDGLYYRCKVIDHEAQDNVLVHFIDYGNDEIISMKDMLPLTALEGPEVEYLLTAAAQAKEYVLAAYWNTNWTEQALTEIRGLIVNEVVQTECFSSVRDYIFINIAIAERGIADLSQYLIETRNMGQVIDLRSQRELLMLIVDGLEEKDLNMGQMAYTSNTLNQHSRYEVMVSHVQDGPFLFSVQLKKELPELECMMHELQRQRLREFPTDILIGMACLVRADVVYRGLVTLMGPTSVVVCLVDYGRTVTVAYSHLYEIPAQYLKRKIFAIRSTITGYRKLDRYNKQLKERFREIVMGPEGCQLTINVTPLEGSPSLHYCEVFLGTGVNVYDELMKVQTKFLELGLNEPVPNGFDGEVKITWCHSPARFYVRMLRKELEYQKLAIELNEFFEGGDTARPALTEIRIGAICALKGNKQWYRTEILDIKKSEEGQRTLIVNLIDVGRDVEVGLTVLKRLNYDFCQIPPLALECALYKVNVEENPGTVGQFVRALNLQQHPDRVYMMKSYTRITYKSYLIDLLDRRGTVIINRQLDGVSPLSLDQYYVEEGKEEDKSATTTATSGTTNVMSLHGDNNYCNVPASSSSCSSASPQRMTTQNSNNNTTNTNNNNNDAAVADLNYVMPLGQVIGINLVSWVSVDEFYVHLREQQTSFSEFVKSVQAVPKVPLQCPPVAPRGSLMLAMYSTTGLYYRAEVVDYNEALRKYKVFFVDIGVRAIVSADQCYENLFLFTHVPKFSHKCCLVDREKLAAATRDPEATKRIGAIIKGALDMTCCVRERLKDGELNVVQVTIDGRDLLEVVVGGGDGEEMKVGTTERIRSSGEAATPTKMEFLANNEGAAEVTGGQKMSSEMLRNQQLWIKPVDFLSKEVFRFSIKDFKGGELYKGAYEQGAVHLGVYTAVEVMRIENQIYHMRPVKEEILPQLLLENSFSATVSEAPTAVLNRISVQFIHSLGPLTRLLMDMKKHYEENESAANVLVPLDVLRQCQSQYFAVLSGDGFWYRAQLIKIADDSEDLLFDLFDYGRREVVVQGKVRHLDLKFRGPNKLATPVYMAIEQFTERIATEVVIREIQQLTKNISLIVKVLENYRGCWIVDIFSNGYSIGQALGSKKLAISCAMAQVRKQIDRDLMELMKSGDCGAEEAEMVVPVAVRQLEAIEIGHFDSPERIFVQLQSELPSLRRMQETLQIVAPSLTAIGAAKMGELCIAQNSFDSQWYRARILDSAPDMTSVQFIDYGNTDVITSDKGAKLKRMIDEFADIPDYAKFCAIPMRPGGRRTDWDDDVFALLSQYMDRPDKECEFLTETKLKRHFIHLYVQGEDLEGVLKAHGWGERVQLIRSGSVCYVSHINSLAEFYLHLDVDGTVLDLLNDYFLLANTFQDAADEPKVNDVLAALYEDGLWYRAKLLRKCVEGWDVLFIDYGNVATVQCFKEIESKEIRDIPALSRKCKLHMPKNILGVSLEAEMLFEEIAQSGETVMEVTLVNLERDYSVVELVVKETGKNVLELLPLNVNPYEHDPEFDH